MIGQELEKYSFEYLIKKALDNVPDDIDKRQGSIIYDAIAPACYQLADIYMELKGVLLKSFITTTYGEYLDNKVIEQGLQRYKATYAKKKCIFTFKENTSKNIPLGSMFSTINEETPLLYKAVEKLSESEYVLKCESIGTIGNGYIGDLLPVTHLQNIESAKITSLIEAARDEETDEELRNRFLLEVNQKPFGGNVAQYDKELRLLDGVGEVQVYPTWNGGGTVKCSIVDTEYNPVSSDVIDKVKSEIDPKGIEGNGLGIAPIGHVVTITTPSVVEVNIEAKIQLLTGYIIDQLRDSINKSIEEYLKTLKKQWGISDDFNRYELTVYRSQITMAILRIIGVANVTDVKINGLDKDLILNENAEIQELPHLNEVKLI
ncbi:baseplate J/gp47 family protein [Clostridium chrysemydis]|uniref:baseplate J/gp47 family protein n=1 Tax=Clostridium chrysemydis TaxID=2665504 RepID=UPI00188362A4|nr:baseplate J/gp47 family protein [Clostridium chrysemydis]